MIANALASLFPTRSDRIFRNASLENPVYSLNDPALYELMAGGSKSAAGVVVSHENSLSIAAVHQAVDLISGDTCKLPLYPYKRLPEDDREIAMKHRAYFCSARRANPNKSARQYWRDMMVHVLLWTNGYGYISQRGTKTEMYNLLPDRTAPEWVKVQDASRPSGYRSELVYVTEVDGKLETLLPSQVFHIRGISLDGTTGADLVKCARDEWGLALAQRNFQSKFFKNGARMGGTLELPAGMSKPAKDNVEEGFRKSYEEGDNPFKVVILRDSAKFHAGQITPEQSQLVDSRDQEKREVASFFNIPPSKLGIRDSVSYNSFEQDNLSYLYGCLDHWLGTIDDEADMKLLSKEELENDTHYFEHNVSKFTRVDYKTQNEVLEIQRRNEIINANDWRKKLNMPKRSDAGGEDYLNPNTKPAPGAGETAKPEKPAKEPPKKNAHKALFVDTFARMARRVALDARKAVKGGAPKVESWLAGKATDHKGVFRESVQPVAAAYAEVFGGESEAIYTNSEADFFGPLLTDLQVMYDSDTMDRAEVYLQNFERTTPERVAARIFTEQAHA